MLPLLAMATTTQKNKQFHRKKEKITYKIATFKN